jgi:hypothetical protein
MVSKIVVVGSIPTACIFLLFIFIRHSLNGKTMVFKIVVVGSIPTACKKKSLSLIGRAMAF